MPPDWRQKKIASVMAQKPAGEKCPRCEKRAVPRMQRINRKIVPCCRYCGSVLPKKKEVK
jgi:ribosomal protein L37AE/L43A